jgi:hypothetical protein
MSTSSWIIRIVGVVALLIGIAAVGYVAYTAGLAQNQTAVPVVVETGDAVVGHAPWMFHPFRGLAFLPGLLCLAPLFLCCFIFLPLRMIFGPHRPPMHWHSKWHAWGEDMPVPPPVAEWHKRMHETQNKEE